MPDAVAGTLRHFRVKNTFSEDLSNELGRIDHSRSAFFGRQWRKRLAHNLPEPVEAKLAGSSS